MGVYVTIINHGCICYGQCIKSGGCEESPGNLVNAMKSV